MLITDREHAISASSTAVCQARTEGTIFENSPLGAIEDANRSGGRTYQDDKRTTGAGAEDRDQHHGSCRSMVRSSLLLVAESSQNQAQRLFASPRHQRKAIGGEVVELGEQVYWRVPGLTQQKSLERGSRKRRGQNLFADADKAPLELAEGLLLRGNDAKEVDVNGAEVPSQIHSVCNCAETRAPSWMQVVSRLAWRTLECVQIEVRARLGGRRLNQGNGGGGE